MSGSPTSSSKWVGELDKYMWGHQNPIADFFCDVSVDVVSVANTNTFTDENV